MGAQKLVGYSTILYRQARVSSIRPSCVMSRIGSEGAGGGRVRLTCQLENCELIHVLYTISSSHPSPLDVQ